ncbi:uncharacterized protein [Symphalangus syndactylus]|uniref:uncharacterized protein n=1 Tax=Symphalangus syndactylus TaxID=9590 RepID=UPI003006CBF6
MTGSTPSVRALIPEIRSLMLFPAGDKLFGGGVGVHPIIIFPLRPSAAETRQTPRAAHPLIEADSGRFRADPRCQGADSIPGALLGEGAARAARLDPGLPVPAEDGDPRRLRPPIRIFSSQTSSAYPDPTAHALAPRQESPFLIPKELTLRRDVPSRTVSRSQERSTQQRSADPDFSRGETQRPTLWTFLPTQPGGRRSPAHPETSPPPSWAAARPSCSSLGGLGPFGRTPFSRTSKTGYLVHALQTTLWTCSLLFKSPTRERGKKNPEEIQVNWKKKFQKGVHRGEKRLYRPSNYNRAFRRMRRDGFPPGPHQKPAHSSHIAPLSARKDSNSTTGRPPFLVLGSCRGCSWHPTGGDCPSPPPSTLEGTSVADTMARFLFPTPVGLASDRSSSLH